MYRYVVVEIDAKDTDEISKMLGKVKGVESVSELTDDQTEVLSNFIKEEYLQNCFILGV